MSTTPNVLESLSVVLIGHTPQAHMLFRVSCHAGYIKVALASDLTTTVYEESAFADQHIRNATLDAFRFDRRHYYRQASQSVAAGDLD